MVSPAIEHVVGVHDAVDEADQHPLRHQLGLARDHRGRAARDRAAARVARLRVVAGDDVIGQQAQRLDIAARGEELEGADPDVARRHARQHRAGQRRLAPAPARRSSRRPATRVVGMPSAAIASLTMYSRSTGPSAARPSPRRENGVGPGALELDVAAHAVAVDDLAEQDGAAVAELRHEVAELVAGIGKRDRLDAMGDAVAREDLHALGARQRLGIEAELAGERGVELDQARRGDRRRREAARRSAPAGGRSCCRTADASRSPAGDGEARRRASREGKACRPRSRSPSLNRRSSPW